MYIRDDRDRGNIFAGLMLFVIIALTLILMAVYVGLIVLYIFLCVGLGIAFIYACVVYVRSLITSIKTVSPVHKYGKLANILLTWLLVLKTTSRDALKGNFVIANNARLKASQYRILSFRKWMWLIVIPGVVVFGTCLIVGLALLQFAIFGIICCICFDLILLLIVLSVISYFPFAVILLFKPLLVKLKSSGIYTFCFKKNATYVLFKTACISFWNGFADIIKALWRDCISTIQSNIAASSTYVIYHILKYIYLASPVGLVIISSIYTILLSILFSIVFIFLAFANLVWTTIVKIFLRR